MYVDIVISNIFYLNKHFFLSFLFFSLLVTCDFHFFKYINILRYEFGKLGEQICPLGAACNGFTYGLLIIKYEKIIDQTYTLIPCNVL